MKQVFCLIVFMAAFIKVSQAQNVKIDSTFGTDGLVYTEQLSNLMYGRTIVVQPDGKIITVGSTSDLYIQINRYNPDGSPDSTFAFSDNTEQYKYYKAAVGLQEDGKILCTDGAYFLYRFNANGLIDTSFGDNGAVPTFKVTTNKIMTQANGKIVLVGYNLNESPGTAPEGGEVLVYNPDGSLDSTFSGDGLFTYHANSFFDWFFCAQIQPDGKILVAGSSGGSSSWRLSMLRLTPDGLIDSTFGVNGIVDQQLSGSTEAYGMALQEDGKIVISGYEYEPYRAVVLRYYPDGSWEKTFGTNGVCYIPDVSEGTDVTVMPDGKLMVYGWLALNNQGYDRSALIQILPNGTLDPSFGIGGIYFSPVLGTETGMVMAKVADNKFVATAMTEYRQILQQFITDLQVGTLNPNTPALNNVLLYPNPIIDNFNLKFHLDASERVRIDLFDPSGKYIMTLLPDTFLEVGEHDEALRLEPSLPGGNYLVSFSISGKPVKKLLITKH